MKKSLKSLKRELVMALALVGGLFLVAGCASIVSGTHQNVKIESSPDAAKVKVERVMLTGNSTEWEGKTPAKVKLSRKEHYLVTISLDGYQKAEIPVEAAGVNGWIWGNIAFGGIFGLIIDTADGAANQLKPDEISVKLAAAPSSQTGQPNRTYAMIYVAGPNGKVQACAVPLKPIGEN